ncbi:MAG: amidohydrolase family protein [Algoriphagus sp.]|nr:amidohydrolase family protein [Algoriphagus sp.]
MAILLQNLQLIHDGKIQPLANYFFDGSSLRAIDLTQKELSFEEIIDCTGLIGSPGWIDLRTGFGEPGQEYRETIASLCESLLVSGFSTAVVMPNTDPVIQSKNEAEFILNRSRKFLPNLIVMGAVTKKTEGEDLTEMLDMHFQAGLTVFGDGAKPLSNSDRYMKILQYLQKFNGVLFDHAYDPLLSIFGQMHEGLVSTKLGMKGIPNLAEDVAIQRNLEIIRYTGGKVHFQTLSTAKGVDLIRQAKKEGLQVTSDVSIYQLIFNDEDLITFDTNLKVKPPFRSEYDRVALIEGLKDGTIDALVSNHQPQDFDSKFAEFDLASFGMAGLQSFLPAMVKLSEELGWELLIEKVTSGPRKIIGSISDSWTIFNPNEEWEYNEITNKSLSANHPWFGNRLKGKVKYVIQKGQFQKIDV